MRDRKVAAAKVRPTEMRRATGTSAGKARPTEMRPTTGTSAAKVRPTEMRWTTGTSTAKVRPTEMRRGGMRGSRNHEHCQRRNGKEGRRDRDSAAQHPLLASMQQCVAWVARGRGSTT